MLAPTHRSVRRRQTRHESINLDGLEARMVFDIAGNTSATAALASLGAAERSITTYTDSVAGGDVADLFRLDLTSRKDVGFIVFPQSAQDLDLELYSNTGTLIAASRSHTNATDSIAIDLMPGTYYIRVVPAGNPDTTPGTSYELSMTWTVSINRDFIGLRSGNVPLGTTFADGPNPPSINPSDPPGLPPPPGGEDTAGNTNASARALALNSLANRYVNYAENASGTDPDLFRIDLNARRDFGVFAYYGPSIADSRLLTGDLQLELYNASGDLIAASRAVGNKNEYILIDLQPGTYYARVVGANAAVAPSAYNVILYWNVSVNRSSIQTAAGTYSRTTAFPPGILPPTFDPAFAPPPIAPAPTDPVPPPAGPPAPPATPTPPPITGPSAAQLAAITLAGTLSGANITKAFSLTADLTSTIFGYTLASKAKIKVTTAAAVGTVLMQLYQADGTLVGSKTTSGSANSIFTSSAKLAAGKYYVRLSLANSASAAGLVMVKKA